MSDRYVWSAEATKYIPGKGGGTDRIALTVVAETAEQALASVGRAVELRVSRVALANDYSIVSLVRGAKVDGAA